MAAVGAHAVERARRPPPRQGPSASGRQLPAAHGVEVEREQLGGVLEGRAQQQATGREAEHGLVRRAAVGLVVPPGHQHLDAARWPPRCCLTSSGSRLSRGRADAPRAVVLDEQEGAHVGGRAGDVVARAPPRRPSSGSRRGRSVRGAQRTTSSSPSRTRRRHSTRLDCGSSGEVGGGELAAARAPARRQSVIRAGTVTRRSPSSRCRRSPSGCSTHGLPGRRRSRVSPAIVVRAPSGRPWPRAAGCAAASRKERTCASATLGGVEVAERLRRARRAARPARRRARRGARGGPPAGGRRRRARPARGVTARSSRARQVSWLMPIVTCRETVSWARAACGVPVGQVHAQARLEQHLPDLAVLAGRRVDLPQLRAVGLEDEDVVGVAVHREALRPGRGEVGVGLAGVAERELELGDQPR